MPSLLFEPDSWRIRPDEFPRCGDATAQARFLVRYAILAPSIGNTQPWAFVAAGNRIEVRADLSRWLPAADPQKRELFLSLGCALENLLVAAEQFGFSHRVEYGARPDVDGVAATVTLSTPGRPSLLRTPELFSAIGVRHTSRRPFESRPVLSQDRHRLLSLRVEPDLKLVLNWDRAMRRTFRRWVVEADAAQFTDPAWRQELAHWTGRGGFGGPSPLAKVREAVLLRVDTGRSRAKRDSNLVSSAPVFGLIGSQRDNRESQVKAGQLYERLCLGAASLGIAVQPLSQVLAVPRVRLQVATLLPGDSLAPMHAFRMGYTEPERRHTPRRRLEDVLR